MDFNKLLARVKAILLTPKSEWPVIGGETATTSSLYSGYICVLAAIPAVCMFIKFAAFGYSVPFLGTMRLGVGTSLTTAITSYVLALVGVFIVALIVNALAPTFGGQKDSVQALKVVAYSYTASWVAGLAYLLPGVGFLLMLLAGLYGIYLLYLGLPATMKCPPDRAVGYTVVTIIAAIVLAIVISAVTSSIGGLRSGLGMGMGATAFNHSGDTATFDRDSNAGKLQAWAKQMEAAGKQMDAAQKSGDVAAQSDAVGKAIAGAVGVAAGAAGAAGNAVNGGTVEALAPDRLKGFLPETLAGMKRVEVSSARNGALGMQVATATARYAGNAGQGLELEITDMGGAKGLLALASWANIEEDKQTQTGFEKTYKQGENILHEQWDSAAKRGEYGAVVGGRFSVKVSGNAASPDDIKSALGAVDLAGLAALRNEGVKSP